MKLIHNARVYTLDSHLSLASAIAIDAGRIVAVGGQELLSRYEHFERQDMGRRIILPGLTDAHFHLQDYILSLQVVDCEAPSRPEILSRLAERLRKTPQGEWLRGHGWNQNAWGGEWPSAADLDAIAPHNPVYLTAKSLHVSWANSLALKMAGITASTHDPENGKIQRDQNGKPTGILFESATTLVEQIIPEPDPERLALTFEQHIPDLWRMGLTGLHDFDRRTCFMALQLLHARRALGLRAC